jgi:citrate lyase subunit beta / citryl-CoA lyase
MTDDVTAAQRPLEALRSMMFTPGNRPDLVAKAIRSGTDAVIVDLEDAVAPDKKVAARRVLGEWLASARTTVVVRINSIDSPWFRDDLALCALPAVSAVMLPKAERAQDLAAVSESAPGKPLLPLIETAAGFDGMRSVAQASHVERLVFGSIDFQLDLGISGEGDELLYFRSQIVLASRLANLAAPVDGVSTSIDDMQALQGDAERARRLGFGAKLCIHPGQVDIVNRSFSPSEVEVLWAQHVLDAAARSNGAAVAVDGKMVDRPVILRAQALLDMRRTA